MTAIIVKFKHETNGKMEIDEISTAGTVTSETKTATKRSASTKDDTDNSESVKRAKTGANTGTEDKITSTDSVNPVVTAATVAEVVAAKETPVTSSS